MILTMMLGCTSEFPESPTLEIYGGGVAGYNTNINMIIPSKP